MKKFLRALFVCVLLLLVAIGGAVGYAAYYFTAPGPLTQPVTILFKAGEGFRAMAEEMGSRGIIRQPMVFEALAVATKSWRSFKAGEYRFAAGATPRQVMAMIAAGKVVVHKFTVAEGLTSREVVQLLYAEPALDGEITKEVKEGTLLPETYHFTYGDKRQDMVQRMQAAMAKQVAALWSKRAPNLPLANPDQAVILASIVEKETGVPEERAHVAAVFINRLRLGMKLQTDPTVIYGLELQNNGKPLGRPLTSADLRQPTPYNTYIIDGLPPGPIANPGRSALEAAMNPADSKDLYFVATGTGGHRFSSTVEEHNANVRLYRQQMQENNKAKP